MISADLMGADFPAVNFETLIFQSPLFYKYKVNSPITCFPLTSPPVSYMHVNTEQAAKLLNVTCSAGKAMEAD